MSWSAYLIGTPDKLVEALQKQSDILTGNSKAEFDAALPHITALLQQNQGKNAPPILNLAASGSAYDGQSSCMIKIENLGSALAMALGFSGKCKAGLKQHLCSTF